MGEVQNSGSASPPGGCGAFKVGEALRYPFLPSSLIFESWSKEKDSQSREKWFHFSYTGFAWAKGPTLRGGEQKVQSGGWHLCSFHPTTEALSIALSHPVFEHLGFPELTFPWISSYQQAIPEDTYHRVTLHTKHKPLRVWIVTNPWGVCVEDSPIQLNKKLYQDTE